MSSSAENLRIAFNQATRDATERDRQTLRTYICCVIELIVLSANTALLGDTDPRRALRRIVRLARDDQRAIRSAGG